MESVLLSQLTFNFNQEENKMAEIFGINDTYAGNVGLDELESERQTLIRLIIDKSGSMSPFESIMVDCLNKFKSAIEGAKESDEMLIGKTLFDSNIDASGYRFIADFTSNYSAGGNTRLYDAIVKEQKDLIDGKGNGYMEHLQQNGIKVKAVLAIFSDGEDNSSQCSANDTRKAIEFLHSKEIIVAFVTFGNGAEGIAKQIGVKDQNILQIDATESGLRKVFEVLSKSAISASKSTGAGNPTDSFFVV